MATHVTRSLLDIHPKVTAAGLAAGLALVADGVCAILGIPAPGWLAPTVAVVAALAAGYLKAG